MVHKVIYPFKDLQDVTKAHPGGRIYQIDDTFPATKRKVSEARIDELEGDNNKLGRSLIVPLEEQGDE